MEENGILKVTDEEIEEAREELGADVYEHEFRRAFKWEGKVYSKLTFDFGSLTGADVLAVEEELLKMRHIVVIPQLDAEYKIRIASRACREPLGDDAFRAMPMRDFVAIMGRVQGFFSSSV